MSFFRIISIIVVHIITSCANRVAPTGGEKDVQPPVLISAIPPDKQTSFSADEIQLTFDEYIMVKDINQQLIISPLLEPTPSVTVKKKTITVDLPDTLQQNTTYTLNFGTAITDIHEGNIFTYQYVFSTGSVLDSLTFSGKAVDALTQTGSKGIKVMLYRDFYDSLPLLGKPDYFAVTNDEGDFTIVNVSPGAYTAIALDDKNSNYKNDNRADESISLPRKVSLPDSTSALISYFKEFPADLYIKNITTSGNRWNINMNKPLVSPEVKLLNRPPASLLHEWNITYDTLYAWTTDSLADSLLISIHANNQGDTAIIRPNLKQTASSGRGNAQSNIIEKNNINKITEGIPLLLTLYNPLSLIDTSKFILMQDTIVVFASINVTDSLKRNISVNYQWKENTTYELLLMPSAITDFSGKQNDTLKINFSPRSLREFGSIEFNITGTKGRSIILQLLQDEKVIAKQRLQGDEKYIFEKLEPAILKARIIYDENSNGKWDTGDYFNKQEAEKVEYYKGDLQARGNWEVEIRWELQQ